MSIPDEITALKREIARLQAELEALESCLEEKAEPVTMDQVQAVVRQLIKPGSPHRDEAKKIVQEYAPKVSAIPEEKLAEVFGRLSELDRGVA